MKRHGHLFHRVCSFEALVSAARKAAKGTHLAIDRARAFTRLYRYFLKLDIRKYFDTIDHEILKRLIRRKFKDNDLLWLIDVFIDHPVPWTSPGKGIPIGNLTSQHFANFYLSGLDHYIKGGKGVVLSAHFACRMNGYIF